MRIRLFVAIALTLTSTAFATRDHYRTASCARLLADPWIRTVVVESIQQITQFPDNWGLAAHQIMYSLIAHFQNPAMDLAFFEQFFRRERIGLYLVANSEPLGPGLWAGYPSVLAKLKPGTPAKYYLWVGVNGAEEAQLFKASLGISDEENLRRLSETGFILGEPEDAAADPQMDMADAGTVQRLKRTSAQKPPSSGGN